jgi:hypothetical protein
MSDQDLLDTMRNVITILGLGQCAPEDLVAAARISAAGREQGRREVADARARIKELEGRLAEWRREKDALEARIATVESAIEATHKVFDGAGVTWSLGNEATRLPIAKRAALAVQPDTLTSTERQALEERLACKEDALKTAHAALTRICEVIGAPIPVSPTDAVEAVKAQLGADSDAENRAKAAEATIAEMVKALDDAGAPRAYAIDKGERPIPDADRVRILGDRWHGERDEWQVEATHAAQRLDALRDAHLALDDRRAPRNADGITLTLAARIRAIPR